MLVCAPNQTSRPSRLDERGHRPRDRGQAPAATAARAGLGRVGSPWQRSFALVRRRISGRCSPSAKITRAQELIASSRIVRAQQRQSRDAAPYARELTRAVEAVISRSDADVDPPVHPVSRRTPSRAAVLILTSDRGFAGGLQRQRPARGAAGLRQTLLGDRGVEPVTVRGRPEGHRLAPVPRARAGRTRVERVLRRRRRTENAPRDHPRPCSRPSTPAARRRRGGRDPPASAPSSSPC